MKLSEYLQSLKPYLAPDLSEADYLDRVFGYSLTDEGADIFCRYKRVEKHYFFTGEREPGFLASKVFRFFDADSFAHYLFEEIEDEGIEDLMSDFETYGFVLEDDESWADGLALLLKSILKKAIEDCRSIRVRGKIQLRAELLEENPTGICPCPHCSNALKLHADEYDSYSLLQAVFLNDDGPKNVSNAIGICNECFQAGEYDMTTLREKKMEFMRAKRAYAELDDPLFPERLTEAARKLKSVRPESLKQLSYNALRIKMKILPGNGILLADIEDKVTRFFPFLMDFFSADDGIGGYSYDELSKSVRAMFEAADAECATQDEVFDALSKKIAALVDESESVGRVITAYFVQTCEVFNEIPE